MELNIHCVCLKCYKESTNVVALEFNFYEQKIYWLCPECGKMNEMVFPTKTAKLPKIRHMR